MKTMETIFENVNMALLAQKDLEAFIAEQYKNGVIPFCVIKDKKRVGPYLKKIEREGIGHVSDQPHVIVLVFNYKQNKIIC